MMLSLDNVQKRDNYVISVYEFAINPFKNT